MRETGLTSSKRDVPTANGFSKGNRAMVSLKNSFTLTKPDSIFGWHAHKVVHLEVNVPFALLAVDVRLTLRRY